MSEGNDRLTVGWWEKCIGCNW